MLPVALSIFRDEFLARKVAGAVGLSPRWSERAPACVSFWRADCGRCGRPPLSNPVPIHRPTRQRDLFLRFAVGISLAAVRRDHCA
jgi:hypothetical protein